MSVKMKANPGSGRMWNFITGVFIGGRARRPSTILVQEIFVS